MEFEKWYTPFVWNTLLIGLNVGIALYYYSIYRGFHTKKHLKVGTAIYVFVILLICSFRPIGKGGYADSQMYIDWFLHAKTHGTPIHHRDIAFDYYQLLLAYLVNVRAFFVVTTLFFISLLLAIGKKINKDWYMLVIPLFLCVDIYFGIMNVLLRNGLAMLLFILATLQTKRFLQMLLFIISILFHKSMVLPVILYLIVKNFDIKIKTLLIVWFLAIPIALIFKSEWYFILESIAFDFRFDYILKLFPESYLYHQTGFRWDFLIVSIFVILYGIYQIFITDYNNSYYNTIVKLYLSLNISWIILMYANHTFRFFALSWFLVPLILGYPYLNQINIKNNFNKYFILIICTVLFSFMMYIKRNIF